MNKNVKIRILDLRSPHFFAAGGFYFKFLNLRPNLRRFIY